jgi:uncharacterized protein (TIGR02145 family)
MKKTLFMLLISLPFGEGWGGALWAQNGVDVSNLAVSAGAPTTVTFDVNWSRQAMQDLNLTVWSDSVWVWVDYNAAGVMTRLPLATGATLTATSAPGTGKVMEETGNNTGVWIVGNARTNGSFSATVRLLTAATGVMGACVYASNYPPVGEYTAADKITFTGTPPYDIVLNHGSGNTITVQSGGTFLLPCGYTVASFTDATTGAPGTFTYIPQGTAQPQGGCTYSEPVALTTFAAFPSNYSASTYVTLTDERDDKNYPVVKIGGRWIMARNLNFQTGLTWQANSKDPSTVSTSGSPTIGHFWCPGTSGATTSARASCEVWGALYAWDTAVSFDGKGAWTENTAYNTGAASATNAKFNHGRTASGSGTGGRGICPPNWHVPTDFEWGVVLDGMEGNGTGTVHQNASGAAWYGTNDQTGAGARGKAKCMCPSGTCATDEAASWTYSSNEALRGNDAYGFHVLPAGGRQCSGSHFYDRGCYAGFWSSSAYDGTHAWSRHFNCNNGNAGRIGSTHYRSDGFAIRCIRNEG